VDGTKLFENILSGGKPSLGKKRKRKEEEAGGKKEKEGPSKKDSGGGEMKDQAKETYLGRGKSKRRGILKVIRATNHREEHEMVKL